MKDHSGACPLGEHLPRVLQPLEHDIAVQTCADAAAEEMGQMRLADKKARRERIERERLGIVRADIAQYLADKRRVRLPGCAARAAAGRETQQLAHQLQQQPARDKLAARRVVRGLLRQTLDQDRDLRMRAVIKVSPRGKAAVREIRLRRDRGKILPADPQHDPFIRLIRRDVRPVQLHGIDQQDVVAQKRIAAPLDKVFHLAAEKVIHLIKIVVMQLDLLHFRVVIMKDLKIRPVHALPGIKGMRPFGHLAHLRIQYSARYAILQANYAILIAIVV